MDKPVFVLKFFFNYFTKTKKLKWESDIKLVGSQCLLLPLFGCKQINYQGIFCLCTECFWSKQSFKPNFPPNKVNLYFETSNIRQELKSWSLEKIYTYTQQEKHSYLYNPEQLNSVQYVILPVKYSRSIVSIKNADKC